jgi:hypothetical protein
MKYILLFLIFVNSTFAQYQEAYITRTTSTNSVFPRQFPSMTIRKMSDKEYWIFESFGTNTIFHRQFPTYIVRKENYGINHPNQKWGVYRTTSTNSVFPRQFPDRYISALEPAEEKPTDKLIYNHTSIEPRQQNMKSSAIEGSSYTYSKSLRRDTKPSYNPETPE